MFYSLVCMFSYMHSQTRGSNIYCPEVKFQILLYKLFCVFAVFAGTFSCHKSEMLSAFVMMLGTVFEKLDVPLENNHVLSTLLSNQAQLCKTLVFTSVNTTQLNSFSQDIKVFAYASVFKCLYLHLVSGKCTIDCACATLNKAEKEERCFTSQPFASSVSNKQTKQNRCGFSSFECDNYDH